MQKVVVVHLGEIPVITPAHAVLRVVCALRQESPRVEKYREDIPEAILEAEIGLVSEPGCFFTPPVEDFHCPEMEEFEVHYERIEERIGESQAAPVEPVPARFAAPSQGEPAVGINRDK